MDETYGYLKLKLPGGIEQEFEVCKGEITVGRGQTNDIVVDDTKVSRSHARFSFSPDGKITVFDSGSTNGVMVNGTLVEQAALLPGDVIIMGDTELRCESASKAELDMTIIDDEIDLERTMSEFVMPFALNETSQDRLVIHTPEKTWEVLLDETIDSLSVGRAVGSDILIDHPSVSRAHARVARDHRTVKLVDLGGRNGLRVRGERFDEVVLEDGVAVRIGYATILFKSGFREEHLTLISQAFKLPERRPVVFVPGIMGSELWLGSERIWPNLKLLFKQPELLMYPGNPGIKPHGILQEVVVVPNLVKLEQYSRMGDYLIEDLGYTRGKDFFEFAYDWRQDVRLTALQLGQFINALPVKTPIKIIAHSLGTLVSRYYIERLGGKDKVDQIILMGGPHFGTPNAVSSLLFGPNMLPFGIMGELLRQVIATFPTAYQILPVYACGLDQFGQPYNFMKNSSWLSPEQKSLWQTARNFKRELGTTTSIPTTCIFGYGQKTVDKIKLNMLAGGEVLNSLFESRANGDGSVPETSAILEGADFHPVRQQHGVLFVDNDVKMRLRLELMGKPFG